MSRRYDTITFLSDYGLDDEFVGVVRSVVRDLAPHVTTVDLTHGIPAHDVRAGALALARSVQYLPDGVVLAVVDPGVGTSRRALAVEVAGGAAVLVGPDNGLLAPAVQMAGGADRAVELTSEAHRLASPGTTFDGRDVFAPAAAHLCNGVDVGVLGPDVDPAALVPATIPVPRLDGERLVCEVLWVDRFGNAQLNVGPEEVEPLGAPLVAEVGADARVVTPVTAYAALKAGQLGLVTDSYGLLALTLDRRPAASELGLGPGDEVILRVAS